MAFSLISPHLSFVSTDANTSGSLMSFLRNGYSLCDKLLVFAIHYSFCAQLIFVGPPPFPF